MRGGVCPALLTIDVSETQMNKSTLETAEEFIWSYVEVQIVALMQMSPPSVAAATYGGPGKRLTIPDPNHLARAPLNLERRFCRELSGEIW